jgi:hypothetical protein
VTRKNCNLQGQGGHCSILSLIFSSRNLRSPHLSIALQLAECGLQLREPSGSKRIRNANIENHPIRPTLTNLPFEEHCQLRQGSEAESLEALKKRKKPILFENRLYFMQKVREN